MTITFPPIENKDASLNYVVEIVHPNGNKAADNDVF